MSNTGPTSPNQLPPRPPVTQTTTVKEPNRFRRIATSKVVIAAVIAFILGAIVGAVATEAADHNGGPRSGFDRGNNPGVVEQGRSDRTDVGPNRDGRGIPSEHESRNSSPEGPLNQQPGDDEADVRPEAPQAPSKENNPQPEDSEQNSR